LVSRKKSKKEFTAILGHFLHSSAVEAKYKECCQAVKKSNIISTEAIVSDKNDSKISTPKNSNKGICSKYKHEILYGLKYSFIVNSS
jgi:hypothetical protein